MLRKLVPAAAAVTLILASPASAADLTGAELASLFHGKTAYIEFAAENANTGGGQGAIYYQADGKVSGKLPNGQLRKGTRTIKDNTACLQWDGAAPVVCTRLEKDGDKLKIIGVDGKPRGIITRIVNGNPEKL